MKKKLTLTNLCMNLMQSYAKFRPVANFLAFISPTCSDNRPHRRQINVFNLKFVANSVKFVTNNISTSLVKTDLLKLLPKIFAKFKVLS